MRGLVFSLVWPRCKPQTDSRGCVPAIHRDGRIEPGWSPDITAERLSPRLRGYAMDLGLRGKKALITGASKGIGRACAEVLAEDGVDLVLVSRTAADLEAVRAKIAGEHNVAVRYYALDLSDSKNVDRLAAECADTDILVNNAGAIPG